MDHVRFKLSCYFKTIRNLWSVIAPGILFHVPVDESSFEMSQKVLITISLPLRCPKRFWLQFLLLWDVPKGIDYNFSLSDFYIVLLRQISWQSFTLEAHRTFAQRTFTTSPTCSPMPLSLTQWSVLLSMRARLSLFSSTSFPTRWGLFKPTTLWQELYDMSPF